MEKFPLISVVQDKGQENSHDISTLPPPNAVQNASYSTSVKEKATVVKVLCTIKQADLW